jgi:hypothetical protein
MAGAVRMNSVKKKSASSHWAGIVQKQFGFQPGLVQPG